MYGWFCEKKKYSNQRWPHFNSSISTSISKDHTLLIIPISTQNRPSTTSCIIKVDDSNNYKTKTAQSTINFWLTVALDQLHYNTLQQYFRNTRKKCLKQQYAPYTCLQFSYHHQATFFLLHFSIKLISSTRSVYIASLRDSCGC